MSSLDCSWQIVGSFESDEQFDRLRSRLDEQVRSHLAVEERVRQRYSGIDWDEHWYRCLATKAIWRLVAPDPPFNGVFEPV